MTELMLNQIQVQRVLRAIGRSTRRRSPQCSLPQRGTQRGGRRSTEMLLNTAPATLVKRHPDDR